MISAQKAKYEAAVSRVLRASARLVVGLRIDGVPQATASALHKEIAEAVAEYQMVSG